MTINQLPTRTDHSANPRTSHGPEPPKKQRLTVNLSKDLIDHARNAVYWIPGMTLASFAKIAFQETLARWEQHRGKPYPPRRGKLKVGRPIQ